jgi:hypothetical protein
MKTGQKITS